MRGDIHMSMNRIEVITSVERRRRFSRAEKERWVLALMEPGANCSEVARQVGVDRSLLYRWRRALSDLARPPGELASFVPVAIVPASAEGPREPSSSLSPATMSIEFGANISMKIEGAPAPNTPGKSMKALALGV